MNIYDEARAFHYSRNCNELLQMGDPDDLTLLNSALLDRNKEKIKVLCEKLEQQKMQYSLVDVADNILNKSRLRIVYLFPFTGMTGGMKILIQQSNTLAQKGHDVLIYSYTPAPAWIECKSRFFLVEREYAMSDVIPPADVVIAGYWSLVPEALKVKAPLKYHMAQGDFDIFEFDKQSDYFKRAIYSAYSQPLKILTVSRIMQKKISDLFHRDSVIIPNAVNSHIFHPVKGGPVQENNPLEILLVGSDTIAFKGHNTIIGAFYCLKNIGYRFNIKWLTQVSLTKTYTNLGLNITEYVAPAQEDIGDIYRSADIYICGSKYEAFCLPVLEAMASGTAVITSDNGGVRDYARDGYNCLVFEPENARMLADKLQMLLDDPGLRQNLRMNAIATARKYSWSKTITKLERELAKAAGSTLQAVKAGPVNPYKR